MTQVAIWEIKGERPVRIKSAGVELEKYLEEWIEHDPSLVSEGLRIVGRQVTLPSGGRLDLLAITPEGKWTVIEIKAGELGNHVFTQALSYAESLATMPAEDLRAKLNRLSHTDASFVDEILKAEDEDFREIQILLVGVGAATVGLQRLSSYLAAYGVPIRLVAFNVYADSAGKKMLLREVTEQEPDPTPKKRRYAVENIQSSAAEKGSAEIFSEALQTAEELELYIRPWANSVTFNSPLNRSLTLVYIQPTPGNTLHVGYHSANFARLYPIAEEEVVELLGPTWVTQHPQEVRQFLQQLKIVMGQIATQQQEEASD